MEGGSKVGSAAAPTSGNASDDVDNRSLFARSLPYTVADAQLEDYFSEVGPVRNCFTVKQKDPPPPSLPWHHKFQDPDDGRQRFLLELEFLQLLSNPIYIHHLAQNRYFDDEAFVGYLKYLLYWKQPEYAKYVMYPHAFFFLDMLQSANFRAAMAHPATKEIAHRQQYYYWKHYRNNRLKQILPRPLPEVPAPPPPPPPAPTPAVAAAPTKPEGSTRAGAGERRKRKHANS